MSVLVQAYLPEAEMPSQEQLNNIETVLREGILGDHTLKSEDVSIVIISCKNKAAVIAVMPDSPISSLLRRVYAENTIDAWEVIRTNFLSAKDMKAQVFVFGEYPDLGSFSTPN